MKNHCMECGHVQTAGAGDERQDGGENFHVVCDVWGRDVRPDAPACRYFAPDGKHGEKETPPAAKQGANEGTTNYTIQSPVLRRAIGDADMGRLTPRSKAGERMIADFLISVGEAANAYAREAGHRAVDTIGRA